MKIKRDSFYKKQIIKRDGLKCKKCGETNIDLLTVDHIKPLSMGGSSKLKNLQFLCVPCHAKKDKNVGQLGYGGRQKRKARLNAKK